MLVRFCTKRVPCAGGEPADAALREQGYCVHCVFGKITAQCLALSSCVGLFHGALTMLVRFCTKRVPCAGGQPANAALREQGYCVHCVFGKITAQCLALSSYVHCVHDSLTAQ